MRILLTGGAGYIGAHTTVALADAGHDVAIVDDLSAVSRVAVDRVRELVGRKVPFLRADIRAESAVTAFIAEIGGVDAIIHLAGVKSVAESVADPVRYFEVNVGGAVSVLRIAEATGIHTIVFSSSATVYSDENAMPVTEDSLTGLDQSSPYGTSKRVVESLLSSATAADRGLRAISLRYFNPVGAHSSGLIGEDPRGEPQNLMPVIARVAAGMRPELSVYGTDYPTPDGTAQRDYIHVLDLAAGHIAALERAPQGMSVFNLGTGTPVSVLELADAFVTANGQQVPRVSAARRPGDLAVSYADSTKALRDLGWRTSRSIQEACADYWRWQQANPRGYAD